MQYYPVGLNKSALGMSPAQTQGVREEKQSAASPCLVQGWSQAVLCGINGSPESCTLYSVGRSLAPGLCCDWGHEDEAGGRECLPNSLPCGREGAEQALVPVSCSRWGNPKAGVGKSKATPSSLCCLPRAPQTLKRSIHGSQAASNKPWISVACSAPCPSLQWKPHPLRLTGELAPPLF